MPRSTRLKKCVMRCASGFSAGRGAVRGRNRRLRLRRNRSLYSRLHHRFAIGPMTPEDSVDYVRVRIGRVGGSKDLFSSDAIAMLHEAAAGSLRDIDRIATLALRSAARRKRKTIERDVISRILQAEGERP